jgi:small-conductance mechanosensitive channel
MWFILIKYLSTAFIVTIVSEIAKRSDKLGALIASLPLVTFLTLIWLYLEKQPMTKVINHAWYTFWYVVPTLPIFLIYPLLLKYFTFWQSIILAIIFTIIIFAIWALVLKKFNINLL